VEFQKRERLKGAKFVVPPSEGMIGVLRHSDSKPGLHTLLIGPLPNFRKGEGIKRA
jgi:hypothetical protein